MQTFTGLLKSCGITSDFNANDCWIMCLPHILNICSKHIIEKYMSTEFLSVPSGAWVDSLGAVIDKSLYINAVKKDSIKHSRNIIHTVCVSSLCHQAYQITIIHSNAMKVWFNEEGEQTKLLLLELLWDVKSHWDSIYFMINLCMWHNKYMPWSLLTKPVVLQFVACKVLDYFFCMQSQQDITYLMLELIEWLILQDMELVLKVCPIFILSHHRSHPHSSDSTIEPLLFQLLDHVSDDLLIQIPHLAQGTMSSKATPMLGAVVLTFKKFIDQWEHLIEVIPRCEPFVHSGLVCANDYYVHLDWTNTYIIAMCTLSLFK